MNRHCSLLSFLACVIGILVFTGGPAVADINGDADASGATVATLQRSELEGFGAEQARLVAAGGAYWRYRSSVALCEVGGSGSFSACWASAVAACASGPVGQGRGPLVDVFRSWVAADGSPLPPPSGVADARGWVWVGSTCLPELVPGAAPVPSVAMIVAAFHRTPWATGRVSIEPVGEVTLVNLVTFFRLSWSVAGFAPGEVDRVDPASMFGYRVDIRPRLVSLVWDFGDGVRFGPTASTGGGFPDGDVRHTYRVPGVVTARVEARFGADFRVNGGGWIPVPDTVTVVQPGTRVTVRQARAVLVNR